MTKHLSDLELAVRLRVALGRLNRQMRQHSPAGLTSSAISTLAGVEALGPVRLGDLAAYEGVTSPTQSRLVAGLEAHGLVERTPDPDDKRATLLAITEEGHHQLERLRTIGAAFLVERLTSLPPEQRERLSDALSVLETLADLDQRGDA
jgi:DNA-binding MarR family transcriptional regulator